jgi:hypothetical protein
MNKKLAIALSLCLLAFSPLCPRFLLENVKASIDSPVRNLNTGLSYRTIQEAIDASATSNGHTIFVNVGTYYENVVISKAISLVGEDRDRTIINGNRLLATISITSSGATISRLTAMNSYCDPPLSGGGGLIILGVSNVQISDVIARNNEGTLGIHIVPGSHDINITNTIVINNEAGIVLNDAWKVNVSNSIIANNKDIGIAIHYGGDHNIIGDNITRNTTGVYCENSSTLKIHWNDIYNNYGSNIETASSSKTVDATHNYWGNDSGSRILGDVIYNPLLPQSALPFAVAIQSPLSGTTVGLTLTVNAQISDFASITRIEFYIKDVLVCTLDKAPYQWAWDTAKYPNGEYPITVKAYDEAENVKTSTATVTVKNEESPWWQTQFWTIMDVLVAIGSLILGIITFLATKRRKKRKNQESAFKHAFSRASRHFWLVFIERLPLKAF